MPVISVMESSTIESVKPVVEHARPRRSGIQVSMDTKKPAKTIHHSAPDDPVHGRAPGVAAAMGGGGGSMVASGSRLESRLRMPGRISRAATMTKNGSDGTTAAFQKLSGGM